LSVASLVSDRRGRISRRRAVITVILSLTAAGVAIAVDPNESRVILQSETALVGCIVVVTAAGVLRRAAPVGPPSPLDRVSRPGPPSPRPLPLDLVRISRRLAAAEASGGPAPPPLAAIAADRLRHGAHTEIDADSVYGHLPEPVPAALALVLDPSLAMRDTRDLPGLDADASAAMVRALEQL